MGQLNNCLSSIADYLCEELPLVVGKNLDHRRKHKAEENVNHGNGRKFSSRPAKKSSSLVVEVMTGVCNLVDTKSVELVREVVDGIHVKVNIVLSIDGLKAELIEEVWSTQLFTFKLFLDLLIRKVRVHSLCSAVSDDAGSKLLFSLKLFIFKAFVSALPVSGSKLEAGFDKSSFQNIFSKDDHWLV